MLTARYLATISDDLVYLYAQLDAEIKRDIFRRLNKLQKVTDPTLHQLEIIQQTGGLYDDVKKLVAKYDEKAQKVLLDLYTEAMNKAAKNDLRRYPLAKRELSDNQAQIMNATIDKIENAELINKTYAAQSKNFLAIKDNITRLTMTVADSCQREFLNQCNRAYMSVSTGAFSWQDAYKKAVIDLSKNGAKVVTKAGNTSFQKSNIIYSGSGTIREYTIENAVKMNVLTSINNTASQQTIENCDALQTSLVEVSAHLGARPEHEQFQGKIYSLKKGGEYYTDSNGVEQFAEDFYEKTAFGTATGLCGINCRHSFYPYFTGLEPSYSNGELDEMKDDRVTMDGKKVTRYEAEQELRLCERAIRSVKNTVYGLEETGNGNSAECIDARERLYEWQKRARDVTKETGIQRKYINEYIGTKDGNQPRGLKPKTEE